MARTGLYFGSFNPVHNGHLIIAQYMFNTGLFDKIRFVISPQNPFKNEEDLYPETDRLNWVAAAIADNPAFEISDAEFHLPKPSYTIQTLDFFEENEPGKKWSIIMGSDNLEKLHAWKSIDKIRELCDFHVYQRSGSENETGLPGGGFTFHKAPFLDISATYIRELLNQKKSVQYLVPDSMISSLQKNEIKYEK